jgi:catechol 2,3-dioxygenase-like lactoylglutathione lyase family enzyme
MALQKLNHITVNSSDLDRSVAFYGDVLGFNMKPMAGRGFVGAWCCIGEEPVVHLVARRADQSPDTRGLLDHFAIEATDPAAMRTRLDKAGVTFSENIMPEYAIHQIVVRDPDGVKVELYFNTKAA